MARSIASVSPAGDKRRAMVCVVVGKSHRKWRKAWGVSVMKSLEDHPESKRMGRHFAVHHSFSKSDLSYFGANTQVVPCPPLTSWRTWLTMHQGFHELVTNRSSCRFHISQNRHYFIYCGLRTIARNRYDAKGIFRYNCSVRCWDSSSVHYAFSLFNQG